MEFLITDAEGVALNAAIDVEPKAFTLHSRGGTKGSPNARNIDYAKGLRLVLLRLLQSPVEIVGVWVDSSQVQDLPLATREILSAKDLPSSPEALFTLLSRRMQAVGRAPGKEPGKGNSNKRVRFGLSEGSTEEIVGLLKAVPKTRVNRQTKRTMAHDKLESENDKIEPDKKRPLDTMRPPVRQRDFERALVTFRKLIQSHEPGGREFVSFRQGVVDVEEGYKARVHEHARRQLSAESWSEEEIGTGTILRRVIASITVPGNNLLTWDDRNGEDTRSQVALDRALEEERSGNLEHLFFDLYRNIRDEAVLFGEAVAELGQNYPLLGYLWFLKDLERFVPLRPMGLQAGLSKLGLEYPLAAQCSWENYFGFLEILRDLRPMLADALDDPSLGLLDAHSFVWVIGKWAPGGPQRSAAHSSKTTSFGPIEIAAYVIAGDILKTVASAGGQTVERRVKEKPTDMNHFQLEAHIAALIRSQGERCAISGLTFQLPGKVTDSDFKASPDRIDSDLGYIRGNIQMVCWFINRWKSDDSNENFLRLLKRVAAELS